MGIPLHRIRDIRVLYGLDPWGTTTIDFDGINDAQLARLQARAAGETQTTVLPSSSNELVARCPAPHGHVIACRITAENPDEGFKPTGGLLQELNLRGAMNVWGYFSVSPSGGLHEYADSQFGHVFSWGEDRQEARQNMVLALKDIR